MLDYSTMQNNVIMPLLIYKNDIIYNIISAPGLFNALYKPLYERLMLGSIAAIQSASAILVTPFARAMLRV